MESIETLAYSDREGRVIHDINEAVRQEVTYLSYQYVEKYGHKLSKKKLNTITTRLHNAALKLKVTHVRSN